MIIMKLLVLCVLVASATAATSTLQESNGSQNKIVGGTYARPGQFPFQLGFYDTHSTPDEFVCGAIIYHNDTMITSGGCVRYFDHNNPDSLVVGAGDLNLVLDEETEQWRKVIRIISHDGFDPDTHENDIALLKIDRPFDLNEYVSGVTLPGKGQIFSGNSFVSGWGTLSSGGSGPLVLQYVSVPMFSDETCRSAYDSNGAFLGWKIKDYMICAGEDGKDTCSGDGGGPMICGDYLCGITSWGVGCGDARYPGVYTKVSYFVDWIHDNE
ncbi:trypsin-1-like [Hyalella azteca]|uniref:Trypsin-1-like n=1 Tax=Hyalella azteca TaxID=294128 RepID=A0A8B7PDP4_HYAAZ|nr:trypsin-1-like [Hyalella azteca]